jgi:hypothetical protein
MVIAETAIAIPALAVVALVLAWGVSLMGTSLTLADAARQVARDIARGVPGDDAVSAAQARAPEAVITVEDLGDQVEVAVARDVAPPVPALSGLTVPLRQTVVIPREWLW